jgi:hypothetical protein
MSSQQLEYRKYLRSWRHSHIYSHRKNITILNRLSGYLFYLYGNDLSIIGSKLDKFIPEFGGC